MITVMKFGGTSVGSVEALRRVAKIIANEQGQKVVVVSAMSGITNFLVSAVEDSKKDLNDVISTFRDKHLNVANELFSGDLLDAFMKEFEVRFKEFKDVILDMERRNDPYYADNVSSQGERFSSLLLAYVLKSMGLKSVALTSEMAGVYATGKPLSGSCDLKKTEGGLNVNVRLLLDDDVIPVITGFYGVNEEGKPLTFGRGGSDYAASAIGNAINADNIQIWTDVNGFMSADPRLVKDAVTLQEMNFSEAAELAHFGAKVLHSRTIEPARLKHIPLWVKNSYEPENHGTLIHHIRGQRKEPLRSVAMKLDLSIVTITVGEISYKPVLLAKILEKLAEAEIIIYGISTSLSNIALLVHNLDVKKSLALLHMLDSIDIERINVRSNMTLICAVGDGLLNRTGFCGDVFGAVKAVGASVEMISEGASDVALNFVVSTDYATEVVKTIHKRFVSGVD
ncbi:MAG: aspartate kinase [Candidatus Methanomethylophilaceae archaeon]|nr:aspartate kinase [Candidatus Methanomethylophilaceae archaeon]MBQ6547591.1 aspartate kinase [Candidatus Methanomethylophilaceae archaeon]